MKFKIEHSYYNDNIKEILKDLPFLKDYQLNEDHKTIKIKNLEQLFELITKINKKGQQVIIDENIITII